jgi:hypothetical protein
MVQDRIITSDIPQPRDAWDTLSMKEKAEMIGVAVRNCIDLDAVKLTKDRLRNGGFDRLKEAMYGDVTGKSQETLGIMLNNPNKNIVWDWVSKHAKDILSKHPTKGTAAVVQNKENWERLVGSNAGAGVLSRFYSWFKDAPQKLQGLQKANRGAAHEFAHYTYMPFGFPKGFNPKTSPLAEYFTGGTRFPNSGEVMARGTQLKNYFGLKEGEELTPEMYRYAQRHYMTDVGDNNMTEFFQSGNPEYPYFPLFLKWINKNAPMIGVGTTLTGTVLNSTNNEQNR